MYTINEVLDTIIQGNALDMLKNIPDKSIDCVITSPPYWKLRDYDVRDQIGKEKTTSRVSNESSSYNQRTQEGDEEYRAHCSGFMVIVITTKKVLIC